MKWMRGRIPAALAVLLMLGTLLAPVAASAEDFGGESADSWRQVLKYAACAGGIVVAPSGLGVAVAVLACTILMTEEAY
jgi:hypothetical protein